MEIIVSSIAVIVAAGCFLAVVSSDLKDSRKKDEQQS
jgi:cbb3-type cytochrome oxidase subunit 3